VAACFDCAHVRRVTSANEVVCKRPQERFALEVELVRMGVLVER
jgi:hypothetical protein